MKTHDRSVPGGKLVSGGQQIVAGGGLLCLALILWAARNFIPTLATTRIMARAVVYALHDGTEAQIERAFAVAKMSVPADATLEPETDPALHGTAYLSVTADTSERARADLESMTVAMKAAFPSAERNLLVSANNSTVPAPNDRSRRIGIGVRVASILMMMGAQILMVFGAHTQGVSRAGLFATIAMPFVFVLLSADSSRRSRSHGQNLSLSDYKFLLVLLAVTPVSVMLSLWLTRKSRRAR